MVKFDFVSFGKLVDENKSFVKCGSVLGLKLFQRAIFSYEHV